jgi:hypothetical protein
MRITAVPRNLNINGMFILTQAIGFKHIIDIISHLLCFDQIAGQRECTPFCI